MAKSSGKENGKESGAKRLEKHIVLLPRENYWDWVKAAQEYVLAYGVNMTQDPGTAGRFAYPEQMVTIVNAPNGYPELGDAVSWFEQEYPEATLDVIEVETPEELAKVLEERVKDEDRYGLYISDPIRLHWPTDYFKITQPFGANPEIYAYYGLPGHEGLDIRAPHNTNVYACADGEVYQVYNQAEGHPYGRHIRIRHANGYRTVYAHLTRVLVSEGEQVVAKQVIGRADSTGNSSGSHLHLSLKKDGATEGGMTHYPHDLIDPTPYMIFPSEGEAAAETYEYPWPLQKCLVGANARADGSFAEADLEVVEKAELEAVKIAMGTPANDIARLRQLNSGLFLMVRLHYELGMDIVTAEDWVARVRPEMRRFYNLGLRYFELHRAPNLQSEGWNYSWHSGGGFARWWMDAAGLLRDQFPDAKLGFPGVSPGGQVEGQRLDAQTFIEQADDGMLTADWLGVNCYWSSETEMGQEEKGAFYKYVRQAFPDKLLFITEFANVNELSNYSVKGREYVDFYKRLRYRAGIGAAFGEVISTSTPYGKLRWREEDGSMTAVVSAVGGR